MMVSTTNSDSTNLIKYHVFVIISLLVAVSFHCSVYRRFDAFETNLVEATRIKMSMDWDELEAFGNYLQSVKLHRKGIQDTIEAYEYEFEAAFLNETVKEEEEDMERWKEDAREKEQQAEIYTRKSAMDGMKSFRNGRDGVGSRVAGLNLARQAKDENERSERMMNQTSQEEALGKEQLLQAQQALLEAEQAQNATFMDKGICKWASTICSLISSGENNRTQPSRAVIQANKDIQSALKMIQEAEEERSIAIELHRNASLHANLSRAILEDAQTFQNQSTDALQSAEEDRSMAKKAQAEAERDREKVQEEQVEIAILEQEIQNDTERSASLLERAAADRSRENYALQRMNRDLDLYETRRFEWKKKMEEATRHISRAGWEALVGSVAGLCLLALVGTRIIATFRYQRPLRWILRDTPFFVQDLWYLVCHFGIFVVAMGFVGELLMDFHQQSNAAKLGITLIFCVSAAAWQVALLYLFPALVIQGSSLDASLVNALVIQKGSILALVSAIEMLLCWCWMGTVAFTRAHRLNNWFFWSVVLCLSAGYAFFLRTQENSFSSQSTYCTISSKAPSNIAISDEQNSLLSPSFQSGIQSSNAFSGSQPSLHTIPVGDFDCHGDEDYGSVSQDFRSFPSTNAPWISDLEKFRLLLEFYLASLGFWIMRRDLELIRKLSPFTTGIVWGQAPLWIVNICLFLILASLIVSIANMKNRGRR